MDWLRRTAPALILAVVGYLLLAALTMRSPGVVGEVEAAQVLDAPPAVLVQVEPMVWADPTRSPHAGHRLGGDWLSLDASQVRPLESLRVGGVALPLAVNSYTGGLPDWPARILHLLTGSRQAVQILHLLLGAGLLVLVWYTARRQRSLVAGGAAVLYLAYDWNFIFYRDVLGGTEVALLAAGVLVVLGLWDRRWRGGSLWWTIPLGVGLGLHAKLTFAAVLAGLAAAALLTRWDRGPMGPPRPRRRRELLLGLGLVGLLLSPLALTWVHHGLGVPATPHVHSHDFLGLQVRRLFEGLGALATGGHAPSREQPLNLISFLVQPLGFFSRACGAHDVPLAAGRVWGWALVMAGTALAWIKRDPSPAWALTRFLSLAVPLAGAALFLANRDMHHLASLSALMGLWGGLATARVAALVSPPRSQRRAILSALLMAPWLVSGALAAWHTDAQLAACTAPLIRSDGQQQLVDRLQDEEIERLVFCDYDLYCLLDLRLPEVELINGWGAMSSSTDRRGTLSQLVGQARGAHLLLVRPTAHTIYGIHTSQTDLARLAADAGATLQPVWELEDEEGVWARLYEVR